MPPKSSNDKAPLVEEEQNPQDKQTHDEPSLESRQRPLSSQEQPKSASESQASPHIVRERDTALPEQEDSTPSEQKCRLLGQSVDGGLFGSALELALLTSAQKNNTRCLGKSPNPPLSSLRELADALEETVKHDAFRRMLNDESSRLENLLSSIEQRDRSCMDVLEDRLAAERKDLDDQLKAKLGNLEDAWAAERKYLGERLTRERENFEDQLTTHRDRLEDQRRLERQFIAVQMTALGDQNRYHLLKMGSLSVLATILSWFGAYFLSR